MHKTAYISNINGNKQKVGFGISLSKCKDIVDRALAMGYTVDEGSICSVLSLKWAAVYIKKTDHKEKKNGL